MEFKRININIKNYGHTKTKTRFAYMTRQLKEMLTNKVKGKPNDLLYTNPNGGMLRNF